MEGTRFWLMISARDRAYGRMWHDTLRLVSLMVASEREVVASFLDYLVAVGVHEEPNIASTK